MKDGCCLRAKAYLSVGKTQEGKTTARQVVENDCPLSTKDSQSVERMFSLKHLEIPANHTDVAATRKHRSAAAGGRSRARLDFPLPEYRNRPFALDTLYGHRACTAVIAFNGGSESRLLMTTGRAPDVARGPRALIKS